MFELKPLSSAGIPAALARVERYRLLNEPRVAESICLDILAADPDNKEAIPMLILTTPFNIARRHMLSNVLKKCFPRRSSSNKRSSFLASQAFLSRINFASATAFAHLLYATNSAVDA